MKPALHIPRIGKTLLAAALVAMAGTAAAAGKAIAGDIDAAKALEFLYGSQAKARSIFSAKYTEQGKEKYIMLAGADGADVLGAAVFVKEGGQWTLEAENRNIPSEVGGEEASGCRLDYDDNPTLARVGTDKHGILIHASAGPGWNGSDCPTVLLPYEGSIRSVLIGAFNYFFSPGMGEAGEGDAHASFDEQSTGEYYDAVVRYTEKNGGKGKAGSRRFQFRDGEYHVVATPKATKKGGKKGAKQRK